MKTACAILIACCCWFASAQDKSPTGGRPSSTRTITPTRAVTKYTALERQLLEAQLSGKTDRVDQLLDDSAEVWSAEKSTPTPREEWKQSLATSKLTSFRLRNMAVHEFGDIAVVSFLLDRRGAKSASMPTLFVVDVWHQDPAKLTVRYQSAPSNPSTVHPPTGKE